MILAEEKQLFEEISDLSEKLDPLLEMSDYESCLTLLARLREPVDAFFSEVMVMDEDPALRRNRLSLLGKLKALFDQIADLAVLG